MFSELGAYRIVLGMFILCLSMVLWEITYSFWGWLVLFIPGSGFLFWGFYTWFRDYY